MSKRIQEIFSEVPHTYEFVNHVLTLGLDILWRRKAAQLAAKGGGHAWLDMCSGTGEMAVYLSRLAEEETIVFAADFSIPMLNKTSEKRGTDRIIFTMADANRLPFRSNAFDLITLSFATRNITASRDALIQTLREFRRILKPGGRLVNVETSQPPSKLFAWLFHAYVRLFVKPIGLIISGSRAAYAYLSHTIRRFYGADELAEVMGQAGFSQVSFRRMVCGVAAIHRGVK